MLDRLTQGTAKTPKCLECDASFSHVNQRSLTAGWGGTAKLTAPMLASNMEQEPSTAEWIVRHSNLVTLSEPGVGPTASVRLQNTAMMITLLQQGICTAPYTH